jgi:hypothetical protein
MQNTNSSTLLLYKGLKEMATRFHVNPYADYIDAALESGNSPSYIGKTPSVSFRILK